ncbi:hypothetical protein E2C01_061358 [Portunus trituberculatus]|uniref:Uncharacterized protein n=1 Tax=Portunus trituberculatus TaxID=210409 RepID=A0A5B7H3M8_PORTR|nr:hypothetical protein [Portunus trituberculatus]
MAVSRVARDGMGCVVFGKAVVKTEWWCVGGMQGGGVCVAWPGGGVKCKVGCQDRFEGNGRGRRTIRWVATGERGCAERVVTGWQSGGSGLGRPSVWCEQHEWLHVVPCLSRPSLLSPLLTFAMKAPCCLLGAAALPRPPERASGTPRPARGSAACRASYTCMLCVCWVVLVVVTRASAYAACPVRTDARDVASKAYVSPQVVEAVVREVGPRAPGRPYTVTVTVNKKLRGYRGRARVKKRDILTLTFRYPLTDTDGGFSAEESDSDGDCLVSAALQPRHKYLLFLSGSNERGAEPLPVAPPETASRKLRRLVRKTVCKNCGEYASCVCRPPRQPSSPPARPAEVCFLSQRRRGGTPSVMLVRTASRRWLWVQPRHTNLTSAQ